VAASRPAIEVMDIIENNQNHEPDPLRHRLREAAPAAEIDGEHRRTLKNSLHARLKRRRRLQILSIGLVSLVLLTGLLLLSDTLNQKFPFRDLLSQVTGISGEPDNELYLSQVEGWTYEGETVFQAIYKRVDSEQVILSRVPQSSGGKIAPALELLMNKQASTIRSTVAAGGALPLPEIDMVLEGFSIHFHRWQVESPDWGNVVYWQGTPLTENQSKS
jgi:hypothetical protein